MVKEQLKRLRDAVTGRDREVEVTPEGVVREVGTDDPSAPGQVGEGAKPEAGKATKLAPRTFGA